VDLGLRDSVVLITGAAGSLGRGLVLGFARQGARLFITDRDGDGLERVREEIQGSGVACAAKGADVTRSNEVHALVSEAARIYEGRVDVLVNAAGIAWQGRIEEMDERSWDEIFAVNCRGAFLFVREVVPFMKERRRGKIVNFSSKSGKTGSALLGAYSAAKAAIIGFTQSLAFELAEYGINVNCVCPGLVRDSGMCDLLFEDYARNLSLSMEEVEKRFAAKVPLNRLGRIDDVVDTVLFLASSRSDYLTGQAVNVSGGREVH